MATRPISAKLHQARDLLNVIDHHLVEARRLANELGICPTHVDAITQVIDVNQLQSNQLYAIATRLELAGTPAQKAP